MSRRVALLGATGSIGRQAIEVVAANPELEVCALQSGSTPLAALAAELDVAEVQVGGDPVRLLERTSPDVVLNAVVGFAGVRATLWSLENGRTLALANKESLVAAGELAIDAATRGGGTIIPVDSEHSALHQCLEGRDPASVASVVLTASGGPFRGRSQADLVSVTPDEALAHPTWTMGPKITIDSATLANKGLEVIEAHWLFDLPYDRIEVIVHPTSVVHSLVRLNDGALLAHLGHPDMRVPISYALNHPRRVETPVAPLPLEGLSLAFEAPDLVAFPMLALARQAGITGGTAPCAYNAANEIAVALFLAGRIRFLDIPATVENVLMHADWPAARDLGELELADAQARRLAESWVERR